MPQTSPLTDLHSALSAARLAAIVESSDDAIISKTLDGVILSWNHAAERVFGYTADEIIGQSIYLLIPPELHEDEKNILARISQGKRISHFETQRRRKDGKLIPIELSLSPILDSNGSIVGISSIKRDISERKEREQAAARLAAVVDSSDDAIVSKTLDGIVMSWNGAAASMYGYSAEEMIGQSIFKLIPPDLVDEERRILAHVSGGVHVGHYETRRLRKDGREITISLSISPIRDADGRILGLSSIKRDITEQKQTENLLRQVAKMESIGRLAGGLAHDFNNQLHALTGLTSFIARDPGLGDTSREDLVEIQKTHERMASLTRQLLAFARQQVLNLETLELNGAILDTLPLLRRLIGSSVQVDVELGDEPRWVKVDRGQLVQVLMNLAINARDAMPRGGDLSIRTERLDVPEGSLLDRLNQPIRPGAYVELEVSDSGEGIPSGFLPRIFEPFFTTKGAGHGTGLGLATVEGIVAQSGGHIQIESEVGRGTTFRVLFQLAAPPIAVPDAAKSRVMKRGRGRVLVVDDEPNVRSVVSRLLQNHGYEVSQAENGKVALDLLAGGAHFDLVISDLVMPVVGGPELGELLALHRPDLPIVWMSGHPQEATDSESVLRSQPYLQKPVPPDVLLQTIHQVLKDSPARGDPGR